MLIDTDTLEVQVNSKTTIPMTELLADALKWKMIGLARHLTVTHHNDLQLMRVGATLYYSFQWTCSCVKGELRFINWVPRVGRPPTESAIEQIRTIPGFVLADFIHAMFDTRSDITSDEQLFRLDNEHFGFLEIG